MNSLCAFYRLLFRSATVILVLGIAAGCSDSTGPDDQSGSALEAVDLGTLGGGFSFPVEINEGGEVVGRSTLEPNQSCFAPDFGCHAFLWRDGELADLGTLGGGFSHALDVNDRGQVVGMSSIAGGERHAFLWQEGEMRDLGTLGGDVSVAVEVNRAGHVVGISTNADGRERAFLWRAGEMIDLGTLGGQISGAIAVNDRGQVVGRSTLERGDTCFDEGAECRGFLWEEGRMKSIGTLGGNRTLPFDVNNEGEVVGSSRTAESEPHAFVWREGEMTDLGTLGGQVSRAWSINDAGTVVGFSTLGGNDFLQAQAFVSRGSDVDGLGVPAGSGSRARAVSEEGLIAGFSTSPSGVSTALLWREDRPVELGTLGSPSGTAIDVNDRGQIVGVSETEAGEVHAVLWQVTNSSGGQAAFSASASEVPSVRSRGSEAYRRVRPTGLGALIAAGLRDDSLRRAIESLFQRERSHRGPGGVP